MKTMYVYHFITALLNATQEKKLIAHGHSGQLFIKNKLYVKKNKLHFFLQFLIHCSNILMANKDKFLTPFLFTIIPSNLIQLLKNEIYTGERCLTKHLKHDPPTTKTHTMIFLFET